jgi:hypothetical protein
MNDKGCAFSCHAFNLNSAPVLLCDDRISDTQTLAGPFTDRLGREKRVEDFINSILRNAASRV